VKNDLLRHSVCTTEALGGYSEKEEYSSDADFDFSDFLHREQNETESERQTNKTTSKKIFDKYICWFRHR
jgi:hypothetical protein